MQLHKFDPDPRLSRAIESFLVQEDFSPANFANRNPVTVLPTSMVVIGIQYGMPMQRVEQGIAVGLGRSGITGLQRSPREYISTGRIGTIIVRFRPGGVSSFTAYPVREFLDSNVELDLVFPRQLVADMHDRLAYATNASERVAIVQRFLLSVRRETDEDRQLLDIAGRMSDQAGSVSIERYAAEAYLCKRTLERKFNAIIGASPKTFASIARFQRTIRLRNAGYGYLDIAEACGYTDHAHYANDFKRFAGCSPESFFASQRQPELSESFNSDSDGIGQNMYR